MDFAFESLFFPAGHQWKNPEAKSEFAATPQRPRVYVDVCTPQTVKRMDSVAPVDSTARKRRLLFDDFKSGVFKIHEKATVNLESLNGCDWLGSLSLKSGGEE